MLSLIEKAITTDTVPITGKNHDSRSNCGVPEGLSISNALANIYLHEIDKKHDEKSTTLLYWRYVDDILILTSDENVEQTILSITTDLSALNLSINKEKTTSGSVKQSFEYLGYLMSLNSISVRRSSIAKLEIALETIFRHYYNSKHKNIEYLRWKINLKVSGFIHEKNKYGWVFFYSQINDLRCLAHLDWLIIKYSKRFHIPSNIKFKKFIRAYNEITYALNSTSYIPNLDLLSSKEKRKIVQEIYGENMRNKDDVLVEKQFRKIMSKEIRDIQKDVQPFS